eukprot:TRINITY_DN3508_c0_g1_i1.p1 TRINITY_DN3508_c0_g1~~TRINITY_DN3508_c0_g1_i1.p1  ORF type:complete len:313 (+),score=48.66 TRINITY_DN3508_c0_g1_i1:216-1154(+)
MGSDRDKTSSRMRMVLMGLVMLAIVSFGGRYMSIENMRKHKVYVEGYVAGHPVAAPFGIALVLIVTLACSLPGVMFLTAACGVLLSPWAVAVATSWLAHVIGGVINFSILRIAWYGSLPSMFKRPNTTVLPSRLGHDGEDDEDEPISPRSRQWLDWMNRKVRHAPAWLLVLLRAVPPLFGPLNAAMAVVDIPLNTYIWTTAVGTLPSSSLLTYFARHVVDAILEEGVTPAPPRGDIIIDDDGPSTTLWHQLLAPKTGFLPPRMKPLNVLVFIPVLWFGSLYVAGHISKAVRMPESRMWRRHPLPHRSHAFTI